ncbi:putative motility protein [Devosia sp. CAU 1758]
MNSDLSTNLLTASTAVTQNSVQIAVLKKTHEMESNLLNSLMQTALSPPPPGQGTKVDKQA